MSAARSGDRTREWAPNGRRAIVSEIGETDAGSAIGAAPASPGTSARDAGDAADAGQAQMEPAEQPSPQTPGMPGAPQPGAPQTVPADRPRVAPEVPVTDMRSAAPGCSREMLQAQADTYLRALGTGDTNELKRHPNARYTENGQVLPLGLGQWVNQPKTTYSRHALDALSCSSSTVAVVGEGLTRAILGVRLRYVEGLLLEIEAQVMGPNVTYWDPDALSATDNAAWTAPLPPNERMSRDALQRLAQRYFDSVADGSLLPPHAPGCKRRQNGTLFDGGGDCGIPAGDRRYEQVRYPVFDEITGVVTAVVLYNGYIGLVLIRAQNDTIQNIDLIGGAAANSTGW